jgi:hypothetical protein
MIPHTYNASLAPLCLIAWCVQNTRRAQITWGLGLTVDSLSQALIHCDLELKEEHPVWR